MTAVVHKLKLPKCDCGKIGEIKLSEEGYTFFLCSECFSEYKKYNKILKVENLQPIELNNYGLFKTKSVVEINSGLSFERWKDFGLKRRNFLKQEASDLPKIRAIFYFYVDQALEINPDNGKIISRSFRGEKRELFRVDFKDLFKEILYAYLTPNSKELLWIEYKDGTILRCR